MRKTTRTEKKCHCCHGTGWDDQAGDKCDECGTEGVIITYSTEEIQDVKAHIISMLEEDSWNGIAVNGTPYTQWKATEEFFSLWKNNKDMIKSHHFSLYKDANRGWVVTLFNQQIGNHPSYEAYNGVKA
jgi:hypothetical protein